MRAYRSERRSDEVVLRELDEIERNLKRTLGDVDPETLGFFSLMCVIVAQEEDQ